MASARHRTQACNLRVAQTLTSRRGQLPLAASRELGFLYSLQGTWDTGPRDKPRPPSYWRRTRRKPGGRQPPWVPIHQNTQPMLRAASTSRFHTMQHGWQCRTEKRHDPARPLASPSRPTEQRSLLSNGIPPSLLNQPCPSQLTSPESLLPLPALVPRLLLRPPLLPPTHPRLCLVLHLCSRRR